MDKIMSIVAVSLLIVTGGIGSWPGILAAGLLLAYSARNCIRGNPDGEN